MSALAGGICAEAVCLMTSRQNARFLRRSGSASAEAMSTSPFALSGLWQSRQKRCRRGFADSISVWWACGVLRAGAVFGAPKEFSGVAKSKRGRRSHNRKADGGKDGYILALTRQPDWPVQIRFFFDTRVPLVTLTARFEGDSRVGVFAETRRRLLIPSGKHLYRWGLCLGSSVGRARPW